MMKFINRRRIIESMDNPSPEKKIHYESVKKYFNKDAAEYHQFYEEKNIQEIQHKLRKRNDWNTYSSLLDDLLTHNPQIETFVDVGCGIGNVLLELLSRKQFATIVGVDFLRETMMVAHKKEQYFNPVDFIQADLLHLPLKERRFDVTICLNVLHHIHKDDFSKALAELSRVTKNYLMVEIRNRDNFMEFFYEHIKLRRKFRNLPQYTISISELRHLLEHEGFRIERIKGKFPAPWMCRRLVVVCKKNPR
jgi:ubiquinone/menaquinone biosynthesis C-methylase UbiE